MYKTTNFEFYQNSFLQAVASDNFIHVNSKKVLEVNITETKKIF